MATFNTNDRVEVRGTRSKAWRAGEVTDASAHGGASYQVTLDTPVNGTAWDAGPRKLRGASLISVVYIAKAGEVMMPGEHIRAE